MQPRKPHINLISPTRFSRSCLRLVPLTRLLPSERQVLVVYLRPCSDLSASHLESDRYFILLISKKEEETVVNSLSIQQESQ